MENLQELFLKKEDLHPDLQPYVYEERMFPCLKHPLVFSVPYSPQMNAFLNKQYEVKLDAIQEALKTHNWSRYIWMHEKPYRMMALHNIYRSINADKFWELLGHVITDLENLYQNMKQLKEMLSSRYHTKTLRYLIMDEEDREYLNSLPRRIKIFRGCCYLNTEGFSWTLKEDKAKWFAKRFFIPGKSHQPILLSGQVNKNNVIAYFSRRNEDEIFVDPKHVSDIKSIVIE